MHQLATEGATTARRDSARAGHTLLEMAVALAIAMALAPPILATAARARASFDLRLTRENAARLFSEARWVAIRDGGATVMLVSDPPQGHLVSATGDTVTAVDLGQRGVELRLSRNRATSRVRYGPIGIGWVSSQTLRFAKSGRERTLVISALGRVSRR